MTPIQSKIQETLEELKTIQSIRGHYDNTSVEIKSAYKELDHLNKVLTKEHEDVENLEKLSVTAVFHKVLGSKDQQLEKERQEYLLASMKYNEHKKSIELLEYEKSILEKKLQDDKRLIGQLENLKKQRETEILKLDPNLANHLLKISEDIDNCIVLKRNIKEAYDEGLKCDEVLNLIIHELKKASQWGQWDTYGRGRTMSSHMKHGAIDRARNLTYQAKHKLVRFKKELADIGIDAYNLDVNIEKFGRFTDIFFDNLISDWIIQKKIKASLNDIVRVKNHIITILNNLKSENEALTEKIERLDIDRDNTLMT